MFPQWFWTLWSDMMIHNIHQRVLLHIKRLSENPAPPPPPRAGEPGNPAGNYVANPAADGVGYPIVACVCHPPRNAYHAGIVCLEGLPNRRGAFYSRRGAGDD